MSEFVIRDQEHYDKSLDWLTKKADEIEAGDTQKNPLKRDAWKTERAKLVANYNLVSDALRMYSQPESCQPPIQKKKSIDDFL